VNSFIRAGGGRSVPTLSFSRRGHRIDALKESFRYRACSGTVTARFSFGQTSQFTGRKEGQE
jgi:hypothetical protein